MLEALKDLFGPGKFVPHGHCYLWQPDLVWLHIISDAGITLAYYTIPLLLLYYTQKRQDIPFRGLLLLFSAFIISCGTTHWLEIWTLWYPVYWVTGLVKLGTAAISLFTALEMVSLIPKALTLPSPAQLEAANRELGLQIAERQRAEEAVHQYNSQLQQALKLEERLKRITDRVRDSLDESQILQTAVQELGSGIGANCCNASSYDLQAGTSTICYEYSVSGSSVKGQVAEIAHFPEVYSQLLQGQYVQFCSLQPNPSYQQGMMLACPIMDDREILGDLWLINDKDYVYSELELRLVQQVANQCAIAIRQARLYHTAQAQVEELERLNRLKDDFLSTISHELRTPMSNIKLATQMLEVTLLHPEVDRRRTEDPMTSYCLQPDSLQKAARYFQVLRDECEREIALINDLLDLSRLDTEKKPLMLSQIEPKTWLPLVVEAFREQTQLHQQQLKLELPTDLPRLTTEQSSLERILMELLSNACKYTPAGETITVGLDVGGGEFCLTVTNTGTEIPAIEHDRVFEKFYRIPNHDPWRYGGTGLGLALVKKLAEHLKATLQLESRASRTTFRLIVPNLGQSQTLITAPERS